MLSETLGKEGDDKRNKGEERKEGRRGKKRKGDRLRDKEERKVDFGLGNSSIIP